MQLSTANRSPGRIARVSTLQILIQRMTLPLTAEIRRLSTRQGLLTGKSTMWPKVRLTVLLSASSRMYGSLHFRRGVLRSTRSGKPRSCWTRSRSSTQEKYGRCTSPQTRYHNILRCCKRCSCKRPGQKCLSRGKPYAPGRSARVSTLETSTQRRTLPLTA